ncbi:MAG: tryptophan--tRNA ligase [Candidatus Doudnabacteria bacterium RIFCSPLOWO2_12_FULL_49_8]|nr:MAG: tryptophan--tRNA ligase [Candidatus Doudnabacteria bacterium RIFCSPLOWO2_12_FULL_49_8]
MKNSILSGIQPTGELHIGNYLGSLKNFVELQDEFDCYFCIVDLHSLTEEFEPGAAKRKQILDIAATFLAAGLDPAKSTLFIQSHVPAHAELAWVFNTITPMGELERMTQYKDKSSRQQANINAGLFDYPVLMAADILLYKPTHVPVGHDQIQHLELTNTIVRKFNHKFGQTFNEVKIYAQKPLRIMSLSEPERKMSKSEPGSFINMFDEPEEIHKKLAKAVTATDAPAGQMPKGVANLFELLTHFGSPADHERLMKEYQGGTIKYSELKQVLGDAIANYFAPMRVKRAELEKNPDQIIKIFTAGAKKAQIVAQATLAEVKQKIGLI